jgi:hypothetical protein
MRPGDRLGHAAERAVHLPFTGKAVLEDFDLERAADGLR